LASPPKPNAPELPEALRGRRQLADDEVWRFGCHAGLPCFSTCCADVSIVLTPIDIVRLARRLEITTQEFLDRYTLLPITKDLHLPVVILKMGEEPAKRCPFVGEQGCTVYDARPWSCRMYPVMEALPPARAGVQPQPVHFLAEDNFCKGHTEAAEWTVARWRADQGADQNADLLQGFHEIVSHPWFIGGRQLNPKQMEMFFTACYNLDTFRRFVFATSFLQRFELDDALVASLREDDEALLRFAYRWLRFALFAEPTVTVRESARREVAPPTSKAEPEASE
jgi:hypothetical protein